MEFNLSLFKDKRDTKPERVRRTWAQLCKKFSKPAIRAEKDGLLFSPATFDPPYRLSENVSEVSQLVLDCDHETTFEGLIASLRLLGCAFAVYSTHSHCRVTEQNPSAEPRFRVVIPLACPIPASKFHGLWRWAAGIRGVVVDPQAKDLARMFYAPAKASHDAPYQSYVDEGAFLDWRELDLSEPVTSNKGVLEARYAQASTNAMLSFAYSEDRNAELCRRIKARGRLNSRRNYDARCLAHNGKSTTSLVYFPDTGRVVCNKGCDSSAILRAEGMTDQPLPSRDTHQTTSEGIVRLRVTCLADVVAEEVSWLWHPYIARGKLTILEGEEGLGKSWLTCALASAVSNGTGFPLSFQPFEAGNVLLLSAEDGMADTIKPRLAAVGANCERVFAIDEPFTLDERGLLAFREALLKHTPTLAIFDPIFAFTGAKLDINRANESRSVMARLKEIAAEFRCAIVLVRHIGKAKGNGDARAAGLGSIDWRVAARSVLLIGKHPDRETERAIVQTKNNLAAFGEGIGFTVEGGRFNWLRESDVTMAQILANVRSADEESETSEAVEFLREALANGPRPARELLREAAELGLTDKRMRTARAKAHVKVEREGFGPGSRSVWSLPRGCPIDAIDAQIIQTASMDAQGTYDAEVTIEA